MILIKINLIQCVNLHLIKIQSNLCLDISNKYINFSTGVRANICRINAKRKPANTSELLPVRANLRYPTAPAAAHVDFDAKTTDSGADDLRASRQSF